MIRKSTRTLLVVAAAAALLYGLSQPITWTSVASNTIAEAGQIVWLDEDRPVFISDLEPSSEDLKISFSTDKSAARNGELVTLTAKIKNEGDHPARGVEVRLPLPRGLEVVQMNASHGKMLFNADNRTVKNLVGGLQAGRTATLKVTTQLNRREINSLRLFTVANLLYRSGSGARVSRLSNSAIVRVILSRN